MPMIFQFSDPWFLYQSQPFVVYGEYAAKNARGSVSTMEIHPNNLGGTIYFFAIGFWGHRVCYSLFLTSDLNFFVS